MVTLIIFLGWVSYFVGVEVSKPLDTDQGEPFGRGQARGAAPPAHAPMTGVWEGEWCGRAWVGVGVCGRRCQYVIRLHERACACACAWFAGVMRVRECT